MFRDTMNQIRSDAERHSEALGDEMEKGGRKAGRRASDSMNEEMERGAERGGKRAAERYGDHYQKEFRKAARSAQKDLDGINVNKFGNDMRREIAKARKELNRLNSVKYHADFDGTKAAADAKALSAQLNALFARSKKIDLSADVLKASRDLAAVGKIADEVANKKRDIKFNFDERGVRRQIGAFEKKVQDAVSNARHELGDRLGEEIDRLRARLKTIGDTRIDIDVTAEEARAEVAEISRELKRLALESPDIRIRAEAGAAYADLLKFNAELTQLDGRHVDVSLRLNAKQAEREMGSFENQLRSAAREAAKSFGVDIPADVDRLKVALANLGNPDIHADFKDAEAIADIRALGAELKRLALQSPDINVRLDAAEALGKLEAVRQRANFIDGKDVDLRVDVNGAGKAVGELTLLDRLLRRNSAGADGGATAFRTFNVVILAALVLIPALIPAVAALSGGLIALIPILGALGAGLGVLILGFSGITDAVKGLSDVQKNGAKDARATAKAQEAAARGIADAQRSLARASQDAARANSDAAKNTARAQQQAAKQIRDAVDSQRDAEARLARAQRDARDAVNDLRAARLKAAKELQDQRKASQNAAAQNALDVRQGVVDVFNATVQNNATQQDGSSTNLDKEVSSINLERARLALKEAREEQQRLAEEGQAVANQTVDSTDTVTSAQDKVTSALEAQRDAQQAVGDAAQRVDQARRDGAQSVADAILAQNRTEADGAQSVADAQRALVRAQQDAKTAAEDTSTSVQNLNDAMGKLGPAGQKFARFIYGLKAGALGLRDSVQEAMLPGVQAGLQTIISTYGPQFQNFATRMGGVIGGLFKKAGQGLGEEPWRAFFSTYSALAPKLLEEFGETTGNWMTVYVRLFTLAAPLVERLSTGLLNLSKRAVAFMNSGEGTAYWNDFFDYVARIGPEVVTTFWNLWKALLRIAEALAPWGETVLAALNGLANFILKMDPHLLGFIATSLVGVALAIQLISGAAAAGRVGALILASPFATLAFILITLSVAVVAAYKNFKPFRDALNSIGKFVERNKNAIVGLSIVVGVLTLYFKRGVIWQAIYWQWLLFGEKAMTLLRKSTILTAIATRIMNTTFKASTIGLIIAGIILAGTAFVLLYKKVKWFRTAVNAVVHFVVWLFSLIGKAAFALWDMLFGHSIFPDIVDGLQWFAGMVKAIVGVVVAIFKGMAIGAKWAWENILKPTLMALWNVFKFVFMNIVIPILKFVFAIWVLEFKIGLWAWNNILKPVLMAIWNVFKFVFMKILVPILKFIFAIWKLEFNAMKTVWTHVLWPVLKAIGAVFKWLWERGVKPILGWIGQRFEDIGHGFKVIWDKVIKPIFDAWVEHVLPRLQSAFSRVMDAITSIWKRLKQAVAAPLVFVVDTVINKGLIAGFNYLAKKVHSEEITPIPLSKGIRNAAKGKARGGRIASASDYNVYPGYTPGRDVGYIGISGGEAIMRPEFTRAVGANWVDSMNAAARNGGIDGVRKRIRDRSGYSGGFKSGGVVWPTTGRRVSTYPGHDGADINGPGQDYGNPIFAFRDGTISYVGFGHGYGDAIFEKVSGGPTVVYGHGSKTYVKAGQSVKAGQLIGRVGSTGNSSGPHLHFGIPGGTYGQAISLLHGALFKAGAAVGDPGVPGWLSSIIGSPLKWLKGKIDKPLEALKDKFGDNPLTSALTKVPLKAAGAMVDKVKSMATSLVGSFMNAGTNNAEKLLGLFGGPKDAGVRTQVQTVAEGYGWGSGKEWDAIGWLISHESGWNPKAQNPSSTAYGLFQFLNGTWAGTGIAKTSAPGLQALAGMRYIKSRYGDPLGAKRYWQSHGSYAEGGVVPSSPVGGAPDNGTMMYDNGGYLPPGLTTVLNLTGKPEPVFTADQFATMGSGGNGAGLHYEPHFHKSDLTPRDVMFDMDVQYKRMSRSSTRYGRDN